MSATSEEAGRRRHGCSVAGGASIVGREAHDESASANVIAAEAIWVGDLNGAPGKYVQGGVFNLMLSFLS